MYHVTFQVSNDYNAGFVSHLQSEKTRSAVAIVLAAGLGKRMESDLPKVFHSMGGRPMVAHVLDAVRGAGIDEIFVVVGHRGELIREYFANQSLTFVDQTEQRGTGHAVQQTESFLMNRDVPILVVNGDVPLLRSSTLRGLREKHEESESAATVLSALFPDPTGYGRIVRNGDGHFEKIVEHRDATDGERLISEINTGTFFFESRTLFPALREIRADNAQQELYLTDVIHILRRQGLRVAAHIAPTWEEVRGVNTPSELQDAEKFFQDVITRVD